MVEIGAIDISAGRGTGGNNGNATVSLVKGKGAEDLRKLQAETGASKSMVVRVALKALSDRLNDGDSFANIALGKKESGKSKK